MFLETLNSFTNRNLIAGLDDSLKFEVVNNDGRHDLLTFDRRFSSYSSSKGILARFSFVLRYFVLTSTWKKKKIQALRFAHDRDSICDKENKQFSRPLYLKRKWVKVCVSDVWESLLHNILFFRYNNKRTGELWFICLPSTMSRAARRLLRLANCGI